MRLKEMKLFLFEKKIKFITETGLSGFYYTAVGFNHKRTAQRVQTLLQVESRINITISKLNSGRYGFIFYEI